MAPHFFIDSVKKVAGLFAKVGLNFDFLADFQAFVCRSEIDRPFGQAGAVGISGGGKAYPVGSHIYRNPVIDLGKGIIGANIMTKGVADFCSMEGPEVIKIPFVVGRSGQDRRMFLPVIGSVDIGIKGDAVAGFHGYIPVYPYGFRFHQILKTSFLQV